MPIFFFEYVSTWRISPYFHEQIENLTPKARNIPTPQTKLLSRPRVLPFRVFETYIFHITPSVATPSDIGVTMERGKRHANKPDLDESKLTAAMPDAPLRNRLTGDTEEEKTLNTRYCRKR